MKTVIFGVLLPLTLFATMPTTDPVSYTWFAEQLKTANDKLRNAVDQLEEAKELNKGVDELQNITNITNSRLYDPRKNLKNISNNVMNLGSRFKRIGKKLANLTADDFMKSHHQVDKNGENNFNDDGVMTQRGWENSKKGFIDTFSNDKDETYIMLTSAMYKAQEDGDYETYSIASQNFTNYLQMKGITREQVKQYALMAPVLVYRELFINPESVKESEKQREQIKDLVASIDDKNNAMDIIKQTQITNQLLSLLLEYTRKEYDMSMKFMYAMTLAEIEIIKNRTPPQGFAQALKDFERESKLGSAKVIEIEKQQDTSMEDFIEKHSKNKKESEYCKGAREIDPTCKY